MYHIIGTIGILSIIKDVNYLTLGGFDLKGPINPAYWHLETFILWERFMIVTIIA